MNQDNLIELFICPCCLRSSIEKTDAVAFRCIDSSCYGYQQKFSIIDNQPVLIDFRNSIFKKENYTNEQLGKVQHRRKGKLHSIIKTIIHGNGIKSKIEIKRFVDILIKDNPKPRLLIVGGGAIGNGVKTVYETTAMDIVSFDVYLSENTHFIADAHQIPLKNESFDAVIVQAVLEHVTNPARVVEEIYRVLKPNALVYAETPFMQQVHEKAYDFTRFTESGHRWLFKNFELIGSGQLTGPAEALKWSIRYFFAGIFRSKKIGQLFSLLFFWVRFFDVIIPSNYQSDGACGVFFLGRKSNSTITEQDIVAFYRGVK
ncbi:class I SAM-dependent methyltransferase [Ferruginibacter albus]|uniref:class I SAM-dependent methyltransferase n=1 Tax=Ferruginibacter albus TaxID=2875540 RepID=UPI001CC39716|nr:class I SAM-dependent methyltransferase [Ferruginibacter albus]UAY52246.1 class I SAM-dependent methyltransferase [Ferruginibacter albus]